MENISNTVFIIDCYSRFDENKNVRMVFLLYNKWYCIREIDKLDWGRPIFKEKRLEEEDSYYHIYSSFEEAKSFVHQLKQLEGQKI